MHCHPTSYLVSFRKLLLVHLVGTFEASFADFLSVAQLQSAARPHQSHQLPRPVLQSHHQLVHPLDTSHQYQAPRPLHLPQPAAQAQAPTRVPPTRSRSLVPVSLPSWVSLPLSKRLDDYVFASSWNLAAFTMAKKYSMTSLRFLLPMHIEHKIL